MRPELSPKAAEFLSFTRELLVQCGYNSFSYAKVAERGNITGASIHHHFPSKEALVKAAVSQYREDAPEALSGLKQHFNDPVAERLPAGHPVAHGPDDPIVRGALLAWLLIFLCGCVLQVALGLGWPLRQPAQRSSHS
ncbi:helix-turn-helix domain containing protein [Roseateles sp. SL47]|uniref:TetR/AcrR family transcriptional regulator n=1 Tax=Roseateles sp. SL47 TaxID=2995138 RepID=UPI00226D78F4|nr:helix-turn-helix domain-containing protein [Roseateles sp. SL47]WAC73505.1 helix-turn-helix domain containing protein [Roseateles sp. SL47]